MDSSEKTTTLGEPAFVIAANSLLRRNGLATEAALALARTQPGKCLGLLPGLLFGKESLGKTLDKGSNLDVTILPYDEGVIQFLRDERNRGRRIVLDAKDYPETAARIARHLNLFDDVISGAGSHGNSAATINGRDGASGSSLKDWLRALRLHQWLKNLLVLVPLAASHQYVQLPLLLNALLAIFCFGLMASGVYVLNDLLDISDDRHHSTKRRRPFAAGRISILSGLAVVPALTIVSFGLAAWLLPPRFLLSLAAYLVLTLAYSLTLKRRMAVDVISLAGLYTLRIVAGGFAIGVPLSFWLLAFSMFLFLSLALVKRYAELFQARAAGSSEKARGRGYWPSDLHMIASLGAASGYMAVMVLSLYVNDSFTSQLYRHPKVIWFACPVLLMWVSRVWMLAHRGHMNEDPLVFAVRDRVSLLLGVILLVVFSAAR